MKEEDNILRQVGTENPFRVPEGYFEHLTSDIMSRLPEKESVMPPTRPVSLWDKIKPWIYMAAMFVGAALIIRVASTGHTPADTVSDEMDQEMEYIHMAMDNTMLDDYSLYVYLTESVDEETK